MFKNMIHIKKLFFLIFLFELLISQNVVNNTTLNFKDNVIVKINGDYIHGSSAAIDISQGSNLIVNGAFVDDGGIISGEGQIILLILNSSCTSSCIKGISFS